MPEDGTNEDSRGGVGLRLDRGGGAADGLRRIREEGGMGRAAHVPGLEEDGALLLVNTVDDGLPGGHLRGPERSRAKERRDRRRCHAMICSASTASPSPDCASLVTAVFRPEDVTTCAGNGSKPHLLLRPDPRSVPKADAHGRDVGRLAGRTAERSGKEHAAHVNFLSRTYKRGNVCVIACLMANEAEGGKSSEEKQQTDAVCPAKIVRSFYHETVALITHVMRRPPPERCS